MEKILIGLDRDGTIIKDVGPLGKEKNWHEQIEFLDNAINGLKWFNTDKRIKLMVGTNQSWVAYGDYSENNVKEVHESLDKILQSNGVVVNSWQYCPYVSIDYAIEHGINLENNYVLSKSDSRLRLRKPEIGMLEKAAEEWGLELKDFSKIFFIGDRESDVMTGINAGGIGILINPKIKCKYYMEPGNITARNLYEAAEWIMKRV